MNIAIFCSGNGTNLQAIIDAVRCGTIQVNIALVVSDNPNAYALTRAKEAGMETFLLRKTDCPAQEVYDKRIIEELEKHNIELIALAGFMRLLSPYFVHAYKNKILNIHPALLPSFKGAHAIKNALEYRVKVTGVTVHFVDEGMDTGTVILQQAVEVTDNDTEETLAAKLHAIEHRLYPQAIKSFVEGKFKNQA